MKSDVLSLGRAVAVLRRIAGTRRLSFQWTGGRNQSQHDFEFLKHFVQLACQSDIYHIYRFCFRNRTADVA